MQQQPLLRGPTLVEAWPFAQQARGFGSRLAFSQQDRLCSTRVLQQQGIAPAVFNKTANKVIAATMGRNAFIAFAFCGVSTLRA
jgi:hypothetical protein